jgi:hypothetical protein
MNNCKHDGCKCQAQADGFCSDSCRQGKMDGQHCGCGHADCK